MIDMHVHVSPEPDLERERTFSDRDMEAETTDLAARLAARGISRALVVLMDERLPHRPELLRRLPRQACGVSLRYCQLVDLRSSDTDVLTEIAETGAVGVKLHPYLQGLTPGDFPAIEALARSAGEAGLFVMVDGEYGSERLFEIRPAEVVMRVAKATAGKVLFAHGGGAAIIDALAIVQALDNVYLDTSFSLDFWAGSSVEQDFAFAIRKTGPERWLYGSDAPFVPLDRAIDVFEDFLARFGFSESVGRQIRSTTAERFLGGRW